jgi:hypothetical protein
MTRSWRAGTRPYKTFLPSRRSFVHLPFLSNGPVSAKSDVQLILLREPAPLGGTAHFSEIWQLESIIPVLFLSVFDQPSLRTIRKTRFYNPLLDVLTPVSMTCDVIVD